MQQSNYFYSLLLAKDKEATEALSKIIYQLHKPYNNSLQKT